MKDIDGNEFQVGDWLRGDNQFGKVTSVEADKLTYMEGKTPVTIVPQDVTDCTITVYHYSRVRRRHLAGQLPDDFFTASDFPAGCDMQKYNSLYYFGDQLAEASWDAGKDINDMDLDNLSGYKEAVGKALTDNEDEAGFMHDMTEWFRNNG